MGEWNIYDAAMTHLLALGRPEQVFWPNSDQTKEQTRFEFKVGPAAPIRADLEGNSETDMLIQVDVVVPSEVYTVQVIDMVGAIQDHFKAGTRISGATVQARPAPATPINDETLGEYKVPITISLRAHL